MLTEFYTLYISLRFTFFFFNDTATTEIYTLSLHDALPILTPVLKTKEVMKLAQIAEDAGVDRLGISDVILYPDTYELQALCATVTNRIRIGSLVTNPFTRHPAVTAAAVSTLDEISDGRAFLGMGAGAGIAKLE